MPALPYVHSQSLKSRFALQLQDAVEHSRITPAQQRWLQGVSDTNVVTSVPRVDRLLTDQNVTLGAELAGAWVISDPADPNAPLFLNTLSYGIERFSDRRSLLDSLNERFLSGWPTPPTLEIEQVDGHLFEQRTMAILDQQAVYLQALIGQLDRLPSLYTAIGENLQAQLKLQLPDTAIDVFEHQLQLVTTPASSAGTLGSIEVIGSQSLVEAALQDHGRQAVDSTHIQRRFLGATGELLEDAQALACRSALADSDTGLVERFEQLVEQYWQSPHGDGTSVRQFGAWAMAEAFRHQLLCSRARQQLTGFEYQCLRTLLPSSRDTADDEPIQASQLAVVLDGQGATKLSGVFVVHFVVLERSDLYLFSPLHGFRRFSSHQQLKAHFSSPEGRLEALRFSSLNEHAALRTQTVLELRLDPIAQPLFDHHMTSVIALQKRNLRHVLALAPIVHQRAEVRVDDALDIRHLIDIRLPQLRDSGRWSAASEHFEQHWGASVAAVNLPAEAHVPRATHSDAWYAQLKLLNQSVELECQLHDAGVGCMRHALNLYLCALSDTVLDAHDLWVQRPNRAPVPLISLALEWFSGHAMAPLPATSKVLDGTSTLASNRVVEALPVDLLASILARACVTFIANYGLRLHRFFARPLRWLDNQLRPLLVDALVRDGALRLELSMMRRRQGFDQQSLDWLEQVLDRPVRQQREAQGNLRVEAHAVQLVYDPNRPALPLNNVFVLTTHAIEGRHVLWSPCDGLSVHASRQALEAFISARFDEAQGRQAWLGLMSEVDRVVLQRLYRGLSASLRLRVQLQRLEGHFIQALQRADLDSWTEDAVHTCLRAKNWKLSAELLGRVLKARECDNHNRRWLSRLGMTLESTVSDALLPSWIKKASLEQLSLFRAIVQDWYRVGHLGKDFLFDIPAPRDYAREKLRTRLRADFPALALDPDRITVTLTRYTPAPVAAGELPMAIPAAVTHEHASLTDFVIGRFAAAPDGLLSTTLDNDPASAGTITPDYLKTLVRTLDIASHYRQLLQTKFSPGDPDYARRGQYFAQTMPSVELLRAYVMRLRNELSEQAYGFFEAVMTMPDGTGRLAVQGLDIIISPLQLCAAPGLPADPVLGAFIIAPRSPQPGPWLLFTLLNADFLIREYAGEQALLSDIRTDEGVQKIILERVSPAAHKRYYNGGFMEPHVPFSTESSLDVPWEVPAPVTLAVTPVSGSALRALFESTGQALQWWYRQMSMTNAEHDRAVSQFLWSLGAEQVLALMPGRLGALVGLWQSHNLLTASVSAVGEQEWGKAVSQLLTALGVLMAARGTAHPEALDPEAPLEVEAKPAIAGRQRVPGFAEFGWSNNKLTPELWARLRPFQVNDLALDTLSRDTLFNTWNDAANEKTYALIDGALYRIGKDKDGWYIAGDEHNGPRITLDSQQQWQLNLQLGLRGGGGILTRVKTGLINAEVDDVIIVEARGMLEVRQTFPSRADDIAQAHALARQYLENCMDNLEQKMLDGSAHHRLKSTVSDFFDVPDPDASLYESVRQVVRTLYGALMDSTLSPYNSPRYIVGTLKQSAESTLAFTFASEQHKNIYLTQHFFQAPHTRLKPSVQRTGNFNPGDHYRAMILLHELSHLHCGTEDIAYVEAHMPFTDLLDDASSYRRSIKDRIVAAQRSTLSYRTPRNELFCTLRDDGVWYDLDRGDGPAKGKVLKLSGKNTLEQARDLFYDDQQGRAQIMLANADSVALLVSLLGRERIAP